MTFLSLGDIIFLFLGNEQICPLLQRTKEKVTQRLSKHIYISILVCMYLHISFFQGYSFYKHPWSQVLMPHTYNPSYSGGRDQEDGGSKPPQSNSLQDPISKRPITKKGWWSGSMYRPWVQAPLPHTHTQKKILAKNHLEQRFYLQNEQTPKSFMENCLPTYLWSIMKI
jgi:hypothetical protein